MLKSLEVHCSTDLTKDLRTFAHDWKASETVIFWEFQLEFVDYVLRYRVSLTSQLVETIRFIRKFRTMWSFLSVFVVRVK